MDIQTKTINIQQTSTITCPQCGHQERESMPENACVYFYECSKCNVLLKPKGGKRYDKCACVYCLFGDVPCPPVQLGDKGDC